MKYQRLLKKKRGLFNSKFGEGPLSCIHVMVNDNGRSICARKQLHLERELEKDWGSTVPSGRMSPVTGVLPMRLYLLK